MPFPFKKGDQGPQIIELQNLLNKKGFQIDTDGVFGPQTYRAVRAFQSQNLDQHGQPLVVDGKVGPITWWSLNNPKPDIRPASAVDYLKMPSPESGGSVMGRAALAAAIGELKAGACEIGGNNYGPWVKKYLEPAGLDEGNSWCASFVSWCYLNACDEDIKKMPFPYSPGARALLDKLRDKGWALSAQDDYQPEPGDVVVWWREQLSGWKGHVGLVHQTLNGMLYTIEGNRSSCVQGFSYVLSRMEKLLGFGHIPDA